MPQFFITYLGSPKPSSAEEGKKHMNKYMDWLASLGDAALSPANPLKGTTTINADGSISNESRSTISGFTIIDVESLEGALAIAKACPYLEIGGSLEVSEIMKMPG